MKWLYEIVNNINGKRYIGVSVAPKRRWKQHTTGNTQCTALKGAMNKYGSDNFTFNTLVKGGDTYIDDLEIKVIELYETLCPKGYNITRGGDGGSKYIWDDKHTELLGTMPDTTINSIIGLPADVIGRRRKAEGIPAYSKYRDTGWEEYLGLISDKYISEKYNIGLGTIQNRRKDKGIPPYNRKPPDTKDIPIEVYMCLGNATDSLIGIVAGISPHRIKSLRRGVNIPKHNPKHGWRKFIPTEYEKTLLHDKHMKVSDVSILLGISGSTVVKYRQEQEVGKYIGERAGGGTNHFPLTEELRKDLLNTEYTNKELSTKYHIPTGTIFWKRKQLGYVHPIFVWTASKIDSLYLKESDKFVGNLLNVGEEAVRLKRREIGVPKRIKTSPSYLKEEPYLTEIMEMKLTTKLLAEKFKVTISQISEVRRWYKRKKNNG